MAQILRSKNLATKFQILLEIAANQPNIRQKDIAQKIDMTPQAISEYVEELIRDGKLTSQGRSRYKVTREGVDWILRMARELQSYTSFVTKVVADLSTSTALADSDLTAGQRVSLYMKDGLLFASGDISSEGATGTAISEAKKGDDVGISNIQGVIRLESGEITIYQVPNVQKGGSANTTVTLLKQEISQGTLVGAIGIEALVALRRAGIEPGYIYGVREAAIQAAHCGLPFSIVCVEDAVSALTQNFEEEGLRYRLVDLRRS